MIIKKKEKQLTPIQIKGIGKRGKNPYIEHNPDDAVKKPNIFREGLLSEQPVKVQAKSSKTGRTITHRFNSPQEAAAHYHKWLTSGRIRNVQLVSEQYEVLAALAEKAYEYDVSNEIIQEVYFRGIDDWSGDKPTNQQQWAFARVNSFLEGGRALELDEDLILEANDYKITNKTSNKSLGRLARRKDSLGRKAKTELNRRLKAEKDSVYGNKGSASKKLQSALTGKSKITPLTAKKLIATLGINPKSAVAKSLNSVANKTAEKKKIQSKVNKEVQKQLQSAELKKQLRDQAKQQKRLESEKLKNQLLDAKAKKARDREDLRARAEAERISQLVHTHIKPVMDKVDKLTTTLPAVIPPHKEPKITRLKPMPDTGPKEKVIKKKGLLASMLKFLGKGKSRPAVSSVGRPLTAIELQKDEE